MKIVAAMAHLLCVKCFSYMFIVGQVAAACVSMLAFPPASDQVQTLVWSVLYHTIFSNPFWFRRNIFSLGYTTCGFEVVQPQDVQNAINSACRCFGNLSCALLLNDVNGSSDVIKVSLSDPDFDSPSATIESHDV